MAIDPRISLMLNPLNVAQPLQIFNQVRQQQIQNERQARLEPLQTQMMQQRLQQGEQSLQSGELDLNNKKDQQDLLSVAQFSKQNRNLFEAQDLPSVTRAIVDRKIKLQQQGRDTTQTDEMINILNSQGLEGLNQKLLATEGIADRLQGRVTAGQRELNQARKILKGVQFDSKGQVVNPESLTTEQRLVAVREGLIPRASISAEERIVTDPELASRVVEFEGDKASEVEGSKLKEQRKRLPNIKAMIKKAEIEAQRQGEVLTDLNRAKAGLPGVQEVVQKLKELAPVATSTLGGKVFDLAAKQLGFGATKGATARARFISTIDNQVLPLLRETFGAAFTAAEGDRLRDALADPDAAPDAKVAQLESFIEQKLRNIETSERELQGLSGGQSQIMRFDAQGNIINGN